MSFLNGDNGNSHIIKTEGRISFIHEGKLITGAIVKGFDASAKAVIVANENTPAKLQSYELTKIDSLVRELNLAKYCDDMTTPPKSEMLVARPKLFLPGYSNPDSIGWLAAGPSYPSVPPHDYPNNSEYVYKPGGWPEPKWHPYGCKCKTIPIYNQCGGFGGWRSGDPIL